MSKEEEEGVPDPVVAAKDTLSREDSILQTTTIDKQQRRWYDDQAQY